MKIALPDGSICEKSGRHLIRTLLDELGINPLEVLVAKNGRIVPEDDAAGDADELRVITIKSGG
jgi:sulfur carrier protein